MATKENRLIDQMPAARDPKEMRVLVLGLARTATKSMQTALEELGYSAYHMSSAFRNENHFNLWNEAIQAKHNSKGIPYGRTEFDKLLQRYDAITDVPAVLFSEELLKAYPDTKVVLTTRNPDKWLKSMDQTILRAMSWPSSRYLSSFDNKMIGPFYRNQILTLKIWTGGDTFNRVKLRQGFVDHYARIRAIVPKENLLEHEPLDGYEPLCRFLSKETPAVNTGYPNINEASHLVAMMRYFWFMLLWKAVKRSLFLASPWLVLAAMVYNMKSFTSTVSRLELVHLRIKVSGHDDEVRRCQVELDLAPEDHQTTFHPPHNSPQELICNNCDMRSFQETQKRWSLVFPDDAIGVDLRQAVKDDDGFNPCEDGLRSLCWKGFLLYGPLSQASWPKKLAESRSAYTSLRDHFLKYIDHPDDLQSAVDPLADDDNSPWSSLRQDEANRQEIFQDVERCMQDNFFFREPSTKKKMLDILFIYSKLNPDTGYRQGMHEILAPILWVVQCDALDPAPLLLPLPEDDQQQDEGIWLMRTALDFEYVEHDSFNLFCAVMQTTKSFYEMGHTNDSSPIVARCHRIHEEILAVVDPELANHLQVIGILPQVYLIRWVRLLFGREFDFDDVLRVWDLLFAESISLGLIDMTCIAMLLRIRWDLVEADYNTALTLLLRYSLPRSSPDKPVSLVRDAFYLDQSRTPQAGAKLIQHYSGKSPNTRAQRSAKESRISTDFSTRRPSTPGSPNQNRPVPRQVGISSPGRTSPARFLPQQKGLESLFHEVSGSLQKRTEGWNLSKTIQGAVNEVKRNMNNSLAASPQVLRASTMIVADPTKEGGATRPASEGLLRRVHELEERNKALAKMLDSALESLRSVRFNEPTTKTIAEDAFNISLAKIQFVSVYLSDPEIPIPPEETAPRQPTVPRTIEEQVPSDAQDVLPGKTDQPAKVSAAAAVPHTKLKPAPGRKALTPVTPQHEPRRQPRPSLAESSFSFMLGEGRHRSSFVSTVADLPEQTRVEQTREADNKSRSKVMVAEDKKNPQREHRGSESEDDGFTLTSL